MGKNLHKVTGFRFKDESLVLKFDVIARENKRNRTQQIEWVLHNFVRDYEAIYGEIKVDDAALND